MQSAAGAIAVRNGALSRLRTATADGESTWLFGGLLVDEWATSSTFVQNDETDQRSIQLNNATVNTELRALYRVRTDANQAIALLNKYKPTPASDIGEMYFARGFAELQLASDFCNGIPLSDGADAPVTLGKPLPVKDVFAAASASFDSAMALSTGTDNASVLVNRAARIAKARALLGMGLSNAAAAAALVTGIPTTYRYDVTASLTGGNNTLWDQPASSNRYTISDSVQGNSRSITVLNAIPFLSANDPRVPAHYKIAQQRQGQREVAGREHLRHSGRQPLGSDVGRGARLRSRRSLDRGRGRAGGRQPRRNDDDPQRAPRHAAADHRVRARRRPARIQAGRRR